LNTEDLIKKLRSAETYKELDGQADPLDLLQATSLLGECYQRFGKPHHLSLSFVAGGTQINISLMRFEREENDE
jgi:hypothetical protein